jgi:GTP-binding protein LepA
MVTKLYSNGGDYSRRKKLLERQKDGKARLREIGKVKLTSEIFSQLRKIL